MACLKSFEFASILVSSSSFRFSPFSFVSSSSFIFPFFPDGFPLSFFFRDAPECGDGRWGLEAEADVVVLSAPKRSLRNSFETLVKSSLDDMERGSGEPP